MDGLNKYWLLRMSACTCVAECAGNGEYIFHWGHLFFEDHVPLVEFIYPVFTGMPGGITVGSSDLCCCVPCLSSAVISLCLVMIFLGRFQTAPWQKAGCTVVLPRLMLQQCLLPRLKLQVNVLPRLKLQVHVLPRL